MNLSVSLTWVVLYTRNIYKYTFLDNLSKIYRCIFRHHGNPYTGSCEKNFFSAIKSGPPSDHWRNSSYNVSILFNFSFILHKVFESEHFKISSFEVPFCDLKFALFANWLFNNFIVFCFTLTQIFPIF